MTKNKLKELELLRKVCSEKMNTEQSLYKSLEKKKKAIDLTLGVEQLELKLCRLSKKDFDFFFFSKNHKESADKFGDYIKLINRIRGTVVFRSCFTEKEKEAIDELITLFAPYKAEVDKLYEIKNEICTLQKAIKDF